MRRYTSWLQSGAVDKVSVRMPPQPTALRSATVSLRLGHGAALTAHRAVIHSRAALRGPQGEGLGGAARLPLGGEAGSPSGLTDEVFHLTIIKLCR